MQIADMTQGLRVQIVRPIEMYPIGIFPPGLIGTVEREGEYGGDDDRSPACHVRLDEPFSSLNEWNNHLQVWSDPECGAAAADDFTPLRPQPQRTDEGEGDA